MATTITPAALTVTIKESITLNGLQRGNEQKLTITGVSAFDSRILTVTSGTHKKLASFGSGTESAGNYDSTAVVYVRVTNLDAVNSVDLILEEADAEGIVGNTSPSAAYFVLGPGKSFLVGTASLNTEAGFGAGAPPSSIATAPTLSGIYAQSDANVDLELVIAST